MRFLVPVLVAVPLAAADFGTTLYPVLERAQCRSCHSDNGVASTTRLQFPLANAPAAVVESFGASLRRFVDGKNVEQSLLWRKPTNRLSHGGGERIRQGSEDERALRAWVEHLATLPENSGGAVAAHKVDAAKPVLRRLTHSQYNHTVRDLLGDTSRPADQFPKEDYVHGFTNQAEGQSISPLQAEAYSRAAERMARNAFRGGDTHHLIPCDPSPACGPRFIRDFGRRVFRRPLTDAEVARYERLFAREGDFLKGAQIVVETMLQSPNFLFHLEPGGYAVASKLSYFLWDTLPDEELLKAAERRDLGTSKGIEAQVRRLLADPKAHDALDEFLAQWLRFDRLRNAIRDRRLYPEFTAELVSAMTEETRQLFGHLVWEDGNFLDFFKGRYTFLGPELARIYGLPAPKEAWTRTDFPADSPRAGIFGQGMFLAVTSKPADTSPTERGIFIREHFLCQQVPPPPPGVNATLPAVTDEKPLTTKQRLQQVHLANASCAGCHQLVDPIGFGLEKFDAIGRYREQERVVIYPTQDDLKTRRKTKPTEHDLTIDNTGSLRGIANSEFRSARELGEILAKEPNCQRCVVKQLFRYAAGRPEEAGDRESLDGAYERFRASQFKFRELIIAIVSSRAFLEGV